MIEPLLQIKKFCICICQYMCWIHYLLQIVFEGTVGVSYLGDIAIDDVSLMDGPCPHLCMMTAFILFSDDEKQAMRFIFNKIIYIMYTNRKCKTNTLLEYILLLYCYYWPLSDWVIDNCLQHDSWPTDSLPTLKYNKIPYWLTILAP